MHRSATIVFALFTTVLGVARSASARVRNGSEFQVSSYTTGFRRFPDVARTGSGNFIAVWSDEQRGAGFGRAFAADGTPLIDDFKISAAAGSHPLAIAANAKGRFVIVSTTAGGGLLGRRFDDSGSPVGAEFQVGSLPGSQLSASAAVDDSGSFVVVFSNRYSVFGQRFAGDATPVGTQFQVNTYSYVADHELNPRVAMDAAGDFVVAWSRWGTGGIETTGIKAQRFQADGTRVGSELQVLQEFCPSCYIQGLTSDAAGNFVVVWEHSAAYAIEARPFSADGSPAGAQFTVGTTGRYSAAISGDSEGNFVVVWSSGDFHSAYNVLGRQFKPNGTPLTDQFQVNTGSVGRLTDTHRPLPAIAVDDVGRFAIVWNDLDTQTGNEAVVAQRFGPTLLEHNFVRFGFVRGGGPVTQPQSVAIGLPPGVAWTASSDQPFVTVSPSSGTGAGTLLIHLVTSALPTSGFVASANIAVTASQVLSEPQVIRAYVTMFESTESRAPIGSFDSPLDGSSGVAGALPVTGWALDDVGVASVSLWRDAVAGDPAGATAPDGTTRIFIGNATFVSGARPDVAALFSTYPNANGAAWGYSLLTNLLPNVSAGTPAGGVGIFTLYAFATDVNGQVTPLGSRTFSCNNTVATKPFGTIDTPQQGETVSGTITNFGWVLTPLPGTVPTTGLTVVVYIDSVPRGTVLYNLPRSDLQTLFPGYNNTNGAVGAFSIDTTTLVNGIHTIAWSVTDNLGRGEGIGSRYFTVQN